jgi:hypothetical protein
MPATPSSEPLVAVRDEVKRACNYLVAASPEALDRCQDALQRAVSELADFRSKDPRIPADAGFRSMAHGLRCEVRRAARLLQSLSDFHYGWERILGSISAGYTVHGDPAPVARSGRICCRG